MERLVTKGPTKEEIASEKYCKNYKPHSGLIIILQMFWMFFEKNANALELSTTPRAENCQNQGHTMKFH